MKEANIFEAWVNNLAEGTWAIPDDKEKQAKLVELMSKEFPVGPDATNATEQLYNLLGDDELFDQLEALAEKNPDADARQVIYDRMQMLSNEPSIQAVINSIQIDDQATMNPAKPTDAGMSAPQDQAQVPTNEENIEDIESIGGDSADNLLKDVATNQDDMDHQSAPVAKSVAEEVKDPNTQTEDPADTKQPEYDEYQDSLLDILRVAGVPAEKRQAPDYEDGVCEDELDEKLIGGQKKLDRDHDGKLTAKDFAMLRKGNAVDEMTTALTSEEEKESPLQGQYGHSGKLKPIGESPDFLTRLKELSGMIRN